MQARESDKGVRLIDAARDGHAQVELRSARAITQHGATVVARSSVNSVDFDHGNVDVATCRVECPRTKPWPASPKNGRLASHLARAPFVAPESRCAGRATQR